MDRRTYATYFDRHYLPRGLALIESLKNVSRAFTIWVLALDQDTGELLDRIAIPEVRVMTLGQLETLHPELVNLYHERSLIEYYFTVGPTFLRFVCDQVRDSSLVTYLDADLFFFCDPESVHQELSPYSVGIVEHDFPPHLKQNVKYGRFNVGWISIRRDENGIACLDWWRNRCLEWCFDRVEGDRFADQKYLDDWPTLFAGVHIIEHPGVNVGPWNLANRRLTQSAGIAEVNGTPLVCFHFHGLARHNVPFRSGRLCVDPGLRAYGVPLSEGLRRLLYEPYLGSLIRSENLSGIPAIESIRVTLRPGATAVVRHAIRSFRDVLNRQVVCASRPR